METLYIQKLREDAIIPIRGSNEAAGYDLTCLESISVNPFSNVLIPTGIAMKIPYGYYGRIAGRSGVSYKTGLMVNAGVIDSDYRGEIKVLMQNPTDKIISFYKGDKVAQIILEKILIAPIEVVESLNETERGSNGFGSTDVQTPKSPHGDLNFII